MSHTAYKRPESVLVLVHTTGGEVLVLERVHPPGYRQSVTGSLGWDETPAQAAARELAEETGITDVTPVDCERRHRFPIHPAWRHRFHPAARDNLEHVFRAELPAPVAVRLDSSEHVAAEWLPRDRAAARVSSETNRAALLELVPAADG